MFLPGGGGGGVGSPPHTSTCAHLWAQQAKLVSKLAFRSFKQNNLKQLILIKNQEFYQKLLFSLIFSKILTNFSIIQVLSEIPCFRLARPGSGVGMEFLKGSLKAIENKKIEI